MKKTAFILLLSLAAFAAGAQDIPKLKPIKDKQLHEGISPSVNKKGKWGYANEKGKFLVKAVFDIAEEFNIVHLEPGDTVSLAKVMIGGKWGILKRDGTFLVAPLFDALDDFRLGVANFQEAAGHGFVSYTGAVLAEQLQDLEKFNADGLAWYKTDGKWGVIRTDGTDLFPPVYSSKAEEKLAGSLLRSEADGKFGVLSLAQKRVFLQPAYDSIATDRICNKLIIFKQNGLLGCMDENGKLLSVPQYEQIQSTRRGDYQRILVRKDNLYGLIDQNGSLVIPPSLRTDQLSTSHKVLQYFKGGSSGYDEPYLYYQDKSYSIGDFDNYLYRNYERSRYTLKNDSNLEFPYWMKGHLNEALDDDSAVARWKRDDAFHPYSDGSFQEWRLPLLDRPEDTPYIILNKNMSIYDTYRIDYSSYSQLETVRISVDGETFPCGSLLEKLFKSVDSKKIQAYDSKFGTSILYDWSSMRFQFAAKKVYNGRLYAVIDIYIDSRLMQRVLTSLSPRGESSFTVKQNGILYDPNNGVSDEICGLACINDRLVLSARTIKEDFFTNVYSLTGQHVISLPDVFVTHISYSPEEYYFFGPGESDVVSAAYRFRPAEKKPVRLPISNFNCEKVDPRVSNGFFFLRDHETGLTYSIVPVTTGETTSGEIPVLRYVMSEWDGRKIVALSMNHWFNIRNAKWTYIPNAGDFVTQIGDVTVHVYPAGENGVAMYSVRYTYEPEESARFGYLGFDEPYFTLPVFEDARDFSDGTVNVKTADGWVNLTKDQLASYTSNPRGA